jgi:iron complex outermembrane receptor protein
MNHVFRLGLLRFAVSTSVISIMACAAVPATAQSDAAAVPAMPLGEALGRIQTLSGTTILFDPDAVRGLMSTPVGDARNAERAVRRATSRTTLVVSRSDDGSLMVTSDILVVARRDEAETGLLVDETTTSDRTGQTLREQPRNTQVISSKLVEEQQAQTLIEALRNAGGVSVNTATVQGGVEYSVRGFSAGGLVNGLPANPNGSFFAGATQPIANIERLEVLKGPDALLAGAGSLGGTVNIVVKKPDAETRLFGSIETGSYGQARGTLDANRALNASRTISARIIAAAATADRNFGGYRGNQDYLFAPSIRFKNAKTDIIAGITLGNQIYGATPYLPINPATNKPFDLPVDRPVLRRADQGIQTETTNFYGEATQEVAKWLTLVVRGQHQKLTLSTSQYAPFGVLNGEGELFISNGEGRQEGPTNAVDGYARVHVETYGVDHTLTVGSTYLTSNMTTYSASRESPGPYNIVTATAPPPPMAPADTRGYTLLGSQKGFYGQYMVKAWRLSVLAGLRRNTYASTIDYYGPTTSTDRGTATTPSYGIVFDATRNLSFFGSLAYGYLPTFALDRNRVKLPDIRSRNLEAGVKLDLFGDRMLLNASWFRIRQSNRPVPDPANPGFQTVAPGQQGTGIDLNLSGQIMTGWTAQGSYTRTKYEMLTPSPFGNVVPGVPRDQYSLYSSYRRTIARDVTAGLGTGIFGRSSAAVTSRGTFYVPSAFQVDLNSFLKVGSLDVNVGLRNVLDRRNYNITYSTGYLPVSEPRNWRLTLGYRFQ